LFKFGISYVVAVRENVCLCVVPSPVFYDNLRFSGRRCYERSRVRECGWEDHSKGLLFHFDGGDWHKVNIDPQLTVRGIQGLTSRLHVCHFAFPEIWREQSWIYRLVTLHHRSSDYFRIFRWTLDNEMGFSCWWPQWNRLGESKQRGRRRSEFDRSTL